MTCSFLDASILNIFESRRGLLVQEEEPCFSISISDQYLSTISVTLAIIVAVATDTVNLPYFVCLRGRPSVKTMSQMLSDTELSLGWQRNHAFIMSAHF